MSYSVTFDPTRKTSPWKVSIPKNVAGRRLRYFFQTEAMAWSEAEAIIAKLRKGGTDSLAPVDGPTMEQAVKMFVPLYEKSSKSHREKVEKVCRWLERDFRCPIRSVSPMMMVQWFAKIPGSDTQRATVYRYVRLFFNKCVKLQLLEKSPFLAVDCPRARSRKGILNADEMRALLDAEMSDSMRASILLGGFAGLRSIEVQRMDWADIDVKAGQVYVRPEVSKPHDGMMDRIVDFTEPITRRKKFFAGKKGRIVPRSARAFYEERRRLAAKLGWDGFPENSLRHSFATYHLARCKSANLTAFQMGHSNSAMVQRVYAVPAARADEKAWWRI
jgi:integrase